MQFASAATTTTAPHAALDELEQAVRQGLGAGAAVDLLLLFVTPHHRAHYAELVSQLHTRLRPRVLLGCAAAGVIGGGREVETRPAISITAGVLPDVALHPFHVEGEDLPDQDAGPGEWAARLGIPTSATSLAGFILLSDPSSMDPRALLEGLDFTWPGSLKVGGLASGRRDDPLFLDRRLVPSGTVGVALGGAVALDAVVAQGCRPIGEPMTVTKCRMNLLEAVDGRPPLEVLGELYEELAESDRELVQRALHIGVAATALGSPDAPRDWLVRNVVGADPERGAVAVGTLLRQGQTVRFHVRDAATAAEDVTGLLSAYAPATPPAGALLFSCTGRGRGLFGKPDHDAGAFKGRLGEVPLGGFFCAGEIGPIGGETHLHGYTSSFAIFRPRPA